MWLISSWQEQHLLSSYKFDFTLTVFVHVPACKLRILFGLKTRKQLAQLTASLTFRGSLHRGAAWEAWLRGRLGQVELADQVSFFPCIYWSIIAEFLVKNFDKARDWHDWKLSPTGSQAMDTFRVDHIHIQILHSATKILLKWFIF
jgi:hypothetical protein